MKSRMNVLIVLLTTAVELHLSSENKYGVVNIINPCLCQILSLEFDLLIGEGMNTYQFPSETSVSVRLVQQLSISYIHVKRYLVRSRKYLIILQVIRRIAVRALEYLLR